jgi:SAM-dependent methyltransferase
MRPACEIGIVNQRAVGTITNTRAACRYVGSANVTRLTGFYGDDLVWIHDTGFGGFAAGLGPELLALFQQHGIADGLVVDIGCGSGIWARQLVDAGYRVQGVDISPAMVALARQRVPTGDFHVGSLWSHPLPACRAVTALGEVVCYLADRRASRARLGAWLRRVFAALEPGGLLVFDVAEVGLDRYRTPTWWQGNDWVCLVSFEYDEARDRLVRNITTFRQTGQCFRRADERHVLQLYHSGQVTDMLRAAGFRVRRRRKFGSFAMLHGRVGFIARKAKT